MIVSSLSRMQTFCRLVVSLNVIVLLSQCAASPEHSVKSMIKEAERSIPGFFRDSVSAYAKVGSFRGQMV